MTFTMVTKNMSLIIQAHIAIISFFASWTWVILFHLINFKVGAIIIAIPLAFFVFLHLILISRSTSDLLQVIWRAYFLGCLFSFGISLSLHASNTFFSAALYLLILSSFHFGEYLATAIFNPSELNLEAFVLNHSVEYNIALLVSWIEHFAWVYFFPGMKSNDTLTYLGFVGCIVGDGFRKLAMYTAGSNFNHVVQYYKQDGHVLVTRGVYSLVRHPSYTGWFCWSISTQVLLSNPICFIAYILASWKFFHDRIEYEELTLISFFGEQYIKYKRKVPSGIPFVYGYDLGNT